MHVCISILKFAIRQESISQSILSKITTRRRSFAEYD